MIILLAENNAILRSAINRYLVLSFGEKNIEVIEAENGEVALETAQRRPDIDIVITGWERKTMSGIELTAKIKENPERQNVRVILQSFTDLSKIGHKADIFLLKGGDPNELVRAIRKLCKERKTS